MNFKIHEKKMKMVEYKNKKLYVINNFDNNIVNEYSEFPIGSVTKLFTIISLLLLNERKQLDIDDYIGKYIDKKELDKVKIIDIINHKSGLKNWYNTPYGSSKKKYTSATEVYNDFKTEKLLTEQKGMFIYSNVGYNLLGVVIEKVSGVSYGEYVDKNILKPLKMDHSGIGETNMTLYNSNNKKLSKYEKWERTKAQSAGQLKCCIYDFIRFSKFTKLLSKKTLELLKMFYIFNNYENTYNIEHGGEISGGSSRLHITFDDKWKMKDIYIKLETGG